MVSFLVITRVIHKLQNGAFTIPEQFSICDIKFDKFTFTQNKNENENKRYGFPLCRIPDGKSPRFPKKPTIRQEGDILIMECILEAHPLPDIAWYQGEKSVTGSDRIKMSRKATSKDIYVLTLEISNPTREDGGNYRCNAFNSYGESNANIALNFQGIRFRFHFTSSYKKSFGQGLRAEQNIGHARVQ